MTQVLFYFPGQKCSIVLDVRDGYNIRVDPISSPYISRVVDPNFNFIDGYHIDMTHIDTGLYVGKFTLPTGAAAVGSYLVDVTYISPITHLSTIEMYNVIVNAPYGNYSVTNF